MNKKLSDSILSNIRENDFFYGTFLVLVECILDELFPAAGFSVIEIG